MHSEQSSIKDANKHSLLIIFIILVVIIICLIGGLIWLNNKPTSNLQQDNEIVDVPNQMDGYDGPISDSTRALLFAQNIQDKLSSDPNYTLEQAITEYEKACEQNSGDLKLYLAIEYVNFLFEMNSDIKQAATILENAEYTEGTQAEMDYLYAMQDLFTRAGDNQKAEEYNQKIKEKTPENVIVYDGRENQ